MNSMRREEAKQPSVADFIQFDRRRRQGHVFYVLATNLILIVVSYKQYPLSLSRLSLLFIWSGQNRYKNDLNELRFRTHSLFETAESVIPSQCHNGESSVNRLVIYLGESGFDLRKFLLEDTLPFEWI